MTTMLEKAVDAALAEVAQCRDVSDADMRRALRAALLAIREPDSAMMASRTGQSDEPYWYERALEADFTAMIDAILNQKPETTT